MSLNLHHVARALGGEISGGQVAAPGPGHAAADRSLAVKLSADAPDGFVVHSFANDDPMTCRDHVRGRLGLAPFSPTRDPIVNMQTRTRHIVAIYDYTDQHGELIKQAVRYEPKGFGQRRPDPDKPGAWVWKVSGTRNVPYRLPDLLAKPDAPIMVTEGEKDADRLAILGLVATTNIGGAGNWTADLNPHFARRTVFIVADNDEPGAKHARQVAEHLAPIATEVRVLDLPGLPPKGDVSDWLDAGGKPDLFVELCLAAPVYRAAANTSDGDGWPEPKPLPSGLLPVMAFDSDTIPVSIGPWVADIADRMQCPPDFVAIPAVVALASTLGRKIAVRPQSKTDWQEVPNLWGCIVGRPGAMKSPAMAEALKPLNRLEAEARKVNEEELKRYNLDYMAHKLRVDEGQKSARAAIKNGTTDISDLIGLEEPEKPAARRFIVGDTTYEALGEILVSNPNGILAFRDELVSLLKTLDREEYINARGFFLTGWNGTSGYPFDRISRGSTYIDAVCISLLGSTQPGRLAEYLARVVKDTAGNDGLIQRFGLLVWPDDTGTWKEVDRYPDTQARTTAWETFTRLNLLTADQVGAERGEYDAIPSLRLDGTARGVFGDWRSDLETRLRTGGMHTALESHLSKYRKLVPSLALLNHLADSGIGPVKELAMLRAIAFSEYLESHARRAYGSGTQVEGATAKAILARIRKGDLAGEFTARDILQRDWSNLSDKEQVAAGLDLLEDLAWIKGTRLSTGGRPKTTYTINPRAPR